MKKILVSACLLGKNCRYDGGNCYNEKIEQLKVKYEIIPICPEQMGGLPTPRTPVELVNDRAVDRNGYDCTVQFIDGADKAVRFAKLYNCKYAVLKSRSPSCGLDHIYDGTFTGRIIKGNGITAERLRKEGITVLDENNFDILL